VLFRLIEGFLEFGDCVTGIIFYVVCGVVCGLFCFWCVFWGCVVFFCLLLCFVLYSELTQLAVNFC
jgi:hypothetical protein